MTAKIKRFFICVLGPPLLGSLPLIVHDTLGVAQTGRASWAPAYLGLAFIFSFLPSLVYFVSMEAWFSQRKVEKYVSTILVSGALGTIAGAFIGYASNYREGVLLFAPLGFMVGVVLGFILELTTRRNQNQTIEEQPIQPLRD